MNFVKAAWEEVLIAHAATIDLDEYFEKFSEETVKHPKRKIERDLYAYAMKRKGCRKELLIEYLEQYSLWQNRPLILARIADFLVESGEQDVASVIYKLAAEKMNEIAPLKALFDNATLS